MRHSSSQSLSTGQIACLQLVAQNLTSKEIALELGISRHTVDQRVRKALRLLGTGTRREAARLVKTHEAYWQVRARSQPEESEAQPVVAEIALERRPLWSLSALPLPLATRAQPRNTMSIGLRLFWILAIGVSAFMASIVYLAGLESLARLLR